MVLWDAGPWYRGGASEATADLTPLVREVVAQPDWQKGDDITFVFVGVEGGGMRTALHRDDHAPPALTVVHTPLSTGTTNGTDGVL